LVRDVRQRERHRGPPQRSYAAPDRGHLHALWRQRFRGERTLGEAIGFLQQKAKELLLDGYSIDYQGESRQFVLEGNTVIVTFLFALIVIFLVLAAQFESFRDPFIILIALPTSMFGALLPLNILGVAGAASMNIYSQIGLVTLIGLISKHGILMVEFANRLQVQEGFGRREAIERAASVRLRPILMTTAAMVVGMVPLIVAEGAGAKSRFAIHRYDFHAVRDAGDLHADCAESWREARQSGFRPKGR
jgi:multidrug efflux pump subunit AcrB